MSNKVSPLSGDFPIKLGPAGSLIAGSLVKAAPEPGYKTLKDEMKDLKNDFLGTSPFVISTPFQGTSLAITQDQSQYIFPSKEGRIAICDSKTKRIILDKDTKEKSIWNLALYNNDSTILTAGSGKIIRKIQLPDLNEIDLLVGHDDEVNYVLVSPDERWAYSGSDDFTVRSWDLSIQNPVSTILYRHYRNVYGMDLSIDGSLLSSVGSDGNLIVYQLIGGAQPNSIVRTLPTDSILWICRFSPDMSLIAAGSEDSNAYIWNTSTWDLVKTLKGHTSRVRCMNFNHTGEVLITGGIDFKIIVWDLKNNKPSITLNLHSDWVRATIVSPDDQYCTSLGDDCKVIRWKIPEFERQTSLESDDSIIIKLWTSIDSKQIHGITEDYIVKTWNSTTGKQISDYKIKETKILHITISYNLKSLYIYTDNPNLEDPDNPTILINLISLSGILEKTFQIKGAEIGCSLTSKNGNYIVVGTKYTLDVYDQDFKVYNSFRKHTSKVTAVAMTSDSVYLFSADTNGSILMSNIPEKSSVKKLLPPAENVFITSLKTSKNNELLYALHASFLQIYSIKMQSKLFTIREGNVKHIGFSLDDSKLFCFGRNELNVYNTENFTLFYTQSFKAPTSYATLSNDTKYYVLYRGSISKINPNFLLSNKSICIGRNTEINEFNNYMIKVIKNQEQKHIKRYDRWAILPNNMNPLHFYAYYNLPTFLEKGMIEDGPFYASKSGHTPLSIALELKYVGCVRAIIKGMTTRLKANPLLFYFFENSLASLNSIGYGGLHRLYNLMLKQSFNRAVPKFSVSKIDLMYREGDSLLIDPRDFMPNDSYSNDGISIRFRQSYCKLPLVVGSQKSLDFIDSLLECENTKIFESELIQLVLQEKWNKIRWVMYIQGLVYTAFSVSLALYTVNYIYSASFLYIPLAIEILIILYKTIQVAINRLEYFEDILNVVDLVKTGLFLSYFISIESGNTDTDNLLSILLFITLGRGITYFRLFSDTRYYINLLYEVVIDVIPFLIIFYYASIGFTVIFFSLNRDIDSIYTDYLITGYPTDLGGYTGASTPNANFDKMSWLNYFLCTLLISIVMLNLVVSILSDTFGRVNDQTIVADSQALLGMIREVEFLYYWNRDEKGTKFIYILSQQEEIPIEKGDLNTKMLKLKRAVTDLAKKINSNRRIVKNFKVKFIESSDKIIESIKDLN